MLEKIKEYKDEMEKEKYLKEVYQKKVEEINGAYTYTYEQFKANVLRTENNE